jgi:3-methyl-2-oxobutanoate hydroxymethyltransferase
MSSQSTVGARKNPRAKVTAPMVIDMKRKGEIVALLTAYDHPMAVLADEAGAEIILVGDSVGTVLPGGDDTDRPLRRGRQVSTILFLMA